MTKTIIASVILLLLCSVVARAGSLAWVPAGPYPYTGPCQPYSFDQPDAIAVDKSDNIYIANDVGLNAVQELTSDGTLRTLLSREAPPVTRGRVSCSRE